MNLGDSCCCNIGWEVITDATNMLPSLSRPAFSLLCTLLVAARQKGTSSTDANNIDLQSSPSGYFLTMLGNLRHSRRYESIGVWRSRGVRHLQQPIRNSRRTNLRYLRAISMVSLLVKLLPAQLCRAFCLLALGLVLTLLPLRQTL